MKGTSYTVNEPDNRANLFSDMHSLCRVIRFKHFFLNKPDNGQGRSQLIPYVKSFRDPPVLSNSQFDEHMLQLEKFYIPESNRRIYNTNELKAMNFLKCQKDIKFSKVDKGGSIILLSKTDYDKLIHAHLNETTTYKLLPLNIDAAIHEKICKLVKDYEICFRN